MPKPRPWSGSKRRAAAKRMTAPIGTLMKKMEFQPAASVRTPPAMTPMEPPAVATKLKMLIDLACSRGS